ncbi:hypothetical protein L484_023647 [Morus notabilis]|uniref:Uncharacterized protein n=1 Tax=Morus notabilis TaxID=981085 RepID=W9RGJ3_9ROSA|nr:hypothetical protein L484_023647 [Morus notabilis]
MEIPKRSVVPSGSRPPYHNIPQLASSEAPKLPALVVSTPHITPPRYVHHDRYHIAPINRARGVKPVQKIRSPSGTDNNRLKPTEEASATSTPTAGDRLTESRKIPPPPYDHPSTAEPPVSLLSLPLPSSSPLLLRRITVAGRSPQSSLQKRRPSCISDRT